MEKNQQAQVHQQSAQLEGNEQMKSMSPPAFQLKSAGANPGDNGVVQRQGEKIGPAGVISKGKGNIQGDKTPVYKKVGDARAGTNVLGYFDDLAEVHVLQDGGLGKTDMLFIYGQFTYAQGGSNKEYVWVDAGRVKMQEAPKKDVAKAPAPKPASDEPKKEEQETWRSIGNLRGNPPVRTENPHNIHVVEDEANYKMLLEMARASLKSITEESNKMNPSGTSVQDNRFWFAKVYQFVTEGELNFVESNVFYYPSYVLLSVIYFEKIYRDNLAAGMKGAEAHWAEAFSRAENGDNDDWVIFFYEAVWNLIDSMLAHIRFDLPRAEAWIFNTHYKPMKGVNFADFKADFMSMGPIFDKAGQRMNKVIEDNCTAFKYTLAKLTPQMGQEFYMTYLEEANMAAERADTWKRAEMLVDKGLNTDDPYTIKDGKITGDVTKGKHRDNIDKLDGGMAPQMTEEAEEMSDSEVLAKMRKLSDDDLGKEPTSTRMRMLFALMAYWTDTEDENAILRILNASSADFVTLVDAVGAWNLLHVTDLGNHTTLRNELKQKYYAKTTPFTAGGVIERCTGGETANWEESAVVDILNAWDGNAGIVKVVEVAGVDAILDNLDGDNNASARSVLRSSYYPKMKVSTAVSVINAALDEYETSEYQEEMIADILIAHPSGREIITKIGESTGAKSDHFKEGLDKIYSTLDGGDQSRLEAVFGEL